MIKAHNVYHYIGLDIFTLLGTKHNFYIKFDYSIIHPRQAFYYMVYLIISYVVQNESCIGLLGDVDKFEVVNELFFCNNILSFMMSMGERLFI